MPLGHDWLDVGGPDNLGFVFLFLLQFTHSSTLKRFSGLSLQETLNGSMYNIISLISVES